MNVEEAIQKVLDCAADVYSEIGEGYEEATYEKAMEIALRQAGIVFETQRVIPLTYRGIIVRDAWDKIDLVVWVADKDSRIAIVADFKCLPEITEKEMKQVERYKFSLEKQLKPGEKVHPAGLIINFPQQKPKKSQPIKTEIHRGAIEFVRVCQVISARH